MNVSRKLDIATVIENKSCFLFGPRQCGKTWLVRNTMPDAHRVDLLRGDMFTRLSRTPGYLEEIAFDGRPVVIDEIQKLPMLLDEVHRLIEEKGLRFLLTGSSARKLRAGGVNLLGGRARIRHLHPFSAVELGDLFNLDRAISHGLLPGIWFSDDPDDDLSSYARLYLEQEVIAEGATRNLPAFSRFLEVAALTSGEQINYSKIASDAQVPRSTVQEYFRILQETLVAREIPVWKHGRSRKTVETSKFYLFDTGVMRKLQGRGELARGTPEWGHAFECLVLNELVAYVDCLVRDTEIAYWRTPAGMEVDFILGDETAIEVKSTENVRPEHLKGLRAIQEEMPFRNRVVVCNEPLPRCVDGILVLPFRDFAERLWAESL